MNLHRFLASGALPSHFRLWSCALLLLFSPLECSAQSFWPTSGQWDQLRASVSTDFAVRQMWTIQDCLADAALNTEPQPISTLSSAGRLVGDAVKEKTASCMMDMEKIQALAVIYKMTGDARYAARAGHFLDAWAKVNVPTGQPIDDTSLEPAIFGYRMVRLDLNVTTREHIDQWMRNMAQAEMNSRRMDSVTAINNWHSHRLKTVGLIGYVLGDMELIAYAREGFRSHIEENLKPSGESIDFIERCALTYHVYDLRPLVTLALALAEDGGDFYHWQAPNGASLARSVTWLLPYVRGEKTHVEFTGSHVHFDKARSDNHEKWHEIGAYYQPDNAQRLMELAAAYDPACAALARKHGIRLRLILSALKSD